MCISDVFNPLASKSSPKMIPLPPLTALKSCQNKVFWNVAMSSSPPDQEDQDWVVAIKFLGRQLSLCSPHRELRWTNILTPSDFSENSNLIFSKRDQRFYLPAPEATTCSHMISTLNKSVILSSMSCSFATFRSCLNLSWSCYIRVVGLNILWSQSPLVNIFLLNGMYLSIL